MHQSVNAIRVVDMIVPEYVVLRYVHFRVSLVTAVHARKLDWISNEEDRQVIEDKVMIAIFGEEFDHADHDAHGDAQWMHRCNCRSHMACSMQRQAACIVVDACG
jgi:hypothetical protein